MRTLFFVAFLFLGVIGTGAGIVPRNTSAKPEVYGPANAAKLAVGSYHVLMVADGKLYGWGDNTQGQLATGKESIEYAPIRIGNDANWKAVTAANFHSIGLKTNGTLWAWGWGNSHEMGLGQATSKTNKPLQIGKDTNWISVSTAPDNTVALKSDGSLWVWGNNVNGQLGVGKTPNSAVYTPTRVGKSNDWASAIASQHIILAIRTDGSLWVWGRRGGSSIYGMDIPDNVIPEPRQIGTEKNWSRIFVHNRHGGAAVIAEKTDGSLWIWGDNRYGKLGTGNTNKIVEPIRLNIPGSIKDCAIGHNHTIMVKQDGSIWHSGNFLQNVDVRAGQKSNSLVFVPLGFPGRWTGVYKGMNFTLLTDQAGNIWTLGINDKGQLGTGNKNSSMTPTKISIGTAL